MRKLTSTIALTLLAVAMSLAQGGGQRGGRGMGQMYAAGSQYGIIARKDVQADIKLTDEQKTKLDAADADQKAAVQAARDNSGGDRTAMMEAMTKARTAHKDAVMGILTDDQKKRVMGIYLQLAGYSALLNPDVQTGVGLTAEQVTAVKDLETKANEANATIFPKMRDESTRTQAMADMKKNNDALKEELGKILTPDEVTKWKDLAGATFTPDPSEPAFGTFGGRPRGGGAAGGGN